MGAKQSAPVCPPAPTCPPPPACPAPVACPPAPKCPPAPTTLGFNYKSVNSITDTFLQKTQNVLAEIQKFGCQQMVPKIIYQIKNEKPGASPQSAVEIKRKFMDSMRNLDNTEGLSEDSRFLLRNSIVKLFNTFVDNATVNGKTDVMKANQDMVDALSSLCPGEMMGNYDGPPRPITDDQFKETQTIFKTFMSSLSESDQTTIRKNVFSKIPNPPNENTTATFDDMTKQLLLASGALKPELKLKLIATINQTRSVVKLPPLSSATTKSTFGSMSHFGSMGGSWIMILLLLIIVALLYFYSQGKLKFPTMGQRVAQFGRDIKSIRGIRVRR